MDHLTGESIGQGASQGSSIRRVALATSIGTTIEWFDFYIYGVAAALVFGPLFFPEFSPVAGTLAAFGTFAVGFISRPIGSIVFGHFGDRIGRKAMLVISLMVMGIGTFLVGLLPTYDTIGIMAPILLVGLRFIQGIGLGGEWGGAALMAAEYAPPGKRGFYTSWPQMGVPPAVFFSNGLFLLFTTTLSQEQFAAWGWRLPFLFSIVLVGVGLYIRLRIAETPVFRRVQESNTQARMPIVDVLRIYPKNVILVGGSFIFNNAMFFILITFMLSYASGTLGVPRNTVLLAILLSSILMFILIPVSAALSDRVGRRPLILIGYALQAINAFPLFWLVDTGQPVLVSLAIIVAMIPLSMVWGCMAAFFAELFGTRVRYSGASLGFQIGTIFGGAFAPIVSTQLLASFGGSWAISVYMLAMAVVSILSVLLLSETYQADITEERAEEHQVVPGA